MSATRVLLLEDGVEDAARIKVWLAEDVRAPFVYDHVVTLAELIGHLGRNHYDVGLLDLCVPDSRGLATVEAVRIASRDLPIVVHSGIEQEKVAIEALKRGAQDYLVKNQMSGPLVRRALRYAVERAKTERELRESRERYQLALEGARDGIWDWDLVGGRLVQSRRWKSMLGFEADDVGDLPEDWFALVHPDDLGGLIRALQDHVEGTTSHFEHEHRARTRQGEWRWMLVRGVVVRDEKGEAVRMAGSQSDITERKLTEARLVHLAMHDRLTGLPNRTLLLHRLTQAMRRAQRQERHHFAVLFLDLDRFKVVNDSMGHLAGDELLVAVAHRLTACVRPGDTVARLGGDEFAILLEDMDPGSDGIDEAARKVAERIHEALGVAVTVGGQEVFTSVSIGITRSGQDYQVPEEVLRDADIAMYQAKQAGRSQHAVFEKAHGRWAKDRLALESGMRRALEREEYEVHYQPIVRIDDGGIVGFEALVRWRHPEQGLLTPAAFIEAAEETGHIGPLGSYVLHRACLDMARLRAVDPLRRDLRLSVNLSGHQLRDAGLAKDVERALSGAQLPADALALELTETALVSNLDTAIGLLRQLREQGVGVHLDDFGAGYSSFGYLRSMPVDTLKIDRAFVDGLPMRRQDQAIVCAVLSLANTLQMGVVAEGIENSEQRSRLRDLDCPLGQGYLFGRPESFADTRRLVTGEAMPAIAM